ncbi:MAG: alkaline phosphatase [Christensenellaceae bacterium]|nr:alkaline phosphatase [Christensenellaceae bacterium]MEA5066036.1 alkaline phosphatase [Eubacteriales bacterium]MEA5068143.1 alkaline phosphatase [Christensenellaceae bacterium]
MKLKSALGLLLTIAMLLATVSAFASGLDSVVVDKPVKNVILLIPDGMSTDGVTLARWYRGGQALNMDELASGLVRTYSADAAIADSAPAGTAMATGHKSHTGFVGVLPEENTMPGLAPLAPEDTLKPVASILEAAKLAGKATGLIATSEIMHATPADFSAHDPSRKNYDALSEQQAHQDIDVVLGAGSKYLEAANRKDGDDILSVIREKYQYVTTPAELAAITSGKVWGMFAEDSLAYDMDRNPDEEPSLGEMTKKAIELLSQDEDGFFLMVEGSKVDWAAHANDPVGIISDVLAFDEAMGVALNFAKQDGHTLIVSATDHGNSGITIGSADTTGDYDKRPLSDFIDPLLKARLTGEGIESLLNEDRSNAAEVIAEHFGITDLTDGEIATIKQAEAGSMNYAIGPMIGRRANIGFTTGGHTGGDVTLYVFAPEGLTQLTGTVENTDIARYMEKAMGVDLDAATQKLFVRAIPAFEAKGATVTFDESDAANPAIVVKKGDAELRMIVNRNAATLNGETVTLDGVVVNSGDLYVPQGAVDLIR